MLFYLAPSIAIGLEKNKNKDSILSFLNTLLDSRKRGLLLIYSSRKTFKRIIVQLEANGNQQEAELLKKISLKERQKKELVKNLSKLVYVSNTTKKLNTNNKLIILNTTDIGKTNLLYPPILLGENLNDCLFYSNIIAEHFHHKDIEAFSKIKIFKKRYQMGGGNSTAAQYDYIKLNKFDLCLCLVDADKKSPSDGLGETAKSVIISDETNKSSICNSIVIDTYSIENLIPFSIIKEKYKVGKNRIQLDAFSRIEEIYKDSGWTYLPLKKGIRGRDLKTQKDYSQYWTEKINNILNIETPCCENDMCDCTIIPKVSHTLLIDSISDVDIDWKKEISEEKKHEVLAMYIKISLAIKSWLCVGEEIRA